MTRRAELIDVALTQEVTLKKKKKWPKAKLVTSEIPWKSVSKMEIQHS